MEMKREKIFRYLSDRKKLFGFSSLKPNLKSGTYLTPAPTINWSPLYITGREGFGAEIFETLEKSNAHYLPGYLYDNNLAVEHVMYWIPEKSSLRDFKLAIGASLIWKYRLSFYTDLETFTASMNQEENEVSHAA